MKTTSKLIIIFIFTFFSLAASAYAQTPREELQQMVDQLQKTPTDNVLREKIIKLVPTLKPSPILPPEAERRMARGAAAFKGSVSAADYQDAAKEFEQATLAAPWYGDAYFNLGVAQDRAANFEGALRSLKLAQLAAPDSKEIKALIYEVEYRQEKANSPKARAASKQLNDDELVRSLNNVRFNCPELKFGSTDEVDEHWLVIKGSEVSVWTKVIQADPDLARANPRDYSLGHVTNARSVPITGTIARQGGGNWEIVYLISSDRIVRESKMDGRAEPSITCKRQ